MILLPVFLFVAAVSFPPMPAGFKVKGDVEKGEQLYQTNCALCHGARGNGKGLAGASLNPPPGDFTHPRKLKTKSDWQRFLIIRDGGQKYGLSPSMASYGSIFKEQDIKEIILFINSFKGNAS